MKKDNGAKATTITENEKDGPSSPNSPQMEGQVPPMPPHHVFSRARKLQIVCIVSLAAVFSPLSSSIYFPALGKISTVSMVLDGESTELILVVLKRLDDPCVFDNHDIHDSPGSSPSFLGSFSDVLGRCPIFIGTLVVYLIANIVLAVSDNYAELMVFRALQAAGSSATISIGE